MKYAGNYVNSAAKKAKFQLVLKRLINKLIITQSEILVGILN